MIGFPGLSTFRSRDRGSSGASVFEVITTADGNAGAGRPAAATASVSRNGRLPHRPGLGPAAVLVAPAAPGWASRRPRCGIGPERYTDATLDPKPRRKTVNPG